MKKLITILFFGCLMTLSATAQNVVYSLTPSTTNADPGDLITVDFTVENFTNMIGLEFQIEWDDAVLSFQDITTYGNIMCNVGGNPSVCFSYPSSFGPANIVDFVVGQYLDGDFINPTPNTIPNGDKLLTLEFEVVGTPGQSTPVNFAGSVLAVNSSFAELSVANGMLTTNNTTVNINSGNCAGVGPVTFTASDESGDTGESRSVKISVDNFDQIEGFGYTINWDPSVISFDSISNLNLAGLTNPPPPGVGSFGTSQTGNGNLFVSWENSNGVTACDGQVIFEIFYTIIGAGGASTDVDFTGNIEVIKNSLLAAHAVNSGSVTATGSGGPLSGIGFTVGDASGDNGTQVCVPVSVSNFDDVVSFQYDITFDESVMTYASILDGNGQPLAPIGAGNPLGLLNPAPPAVGNFGTTNTSNGVISVTWDNQAGVTLPNNTPIYEVCFDIIGSAGETSSVGFGGTIEVADVNGLSTFAGQPGTVTVTGTFNGLNVEWDCCPAAEQGETICVDVRVVNGFTNISSMQYGMTWNSSVFDFSSIQFGNGNPLGLSVGNNLVYDSNADAVKLLYFDNSGVGANVAAGASLYQICFDVIGNVGSSGDLEFGAVPNAIPPLVVEVSNTAGLVNFLGDACNVEVQNIPALSITENVTSPTCNGDADGAIDITVTGGVVDYTFNWSNGATTEDISGLASGDYTVTVYDCYRDSLVQTISVSEPALISITADITNESGAGDDGAIDLTVSGGTSPYTYAWSNNGTTDPLTGLAAGDYTVTVTDANGCEGIETFVVGTACTPITVTGTVTHETSAGNDGTISVTPSGGTPTYNYAWTPNLGNTNNPTGLVPGTYTVTVSDANSCTGTETFVIDAFSCPTITVTPSGTHVTCAGGSDGTASATASGGSGDYSFDWGVNPNTLAAGTYTVTATDNVTGCTGTASVTINDGVTVSLNVVSTTDIICFGQNTGSITISGSGGTAPYIATWSPGGMSGLTISNLVAGAYTPTIMDANGCTATGNPITLTQPNDITYSSNVTDALCNGASDGTIILDIQGGNGGYSVAWGNAGTGASISGLAAGSYTPTITDNQGCQKIGTPITVGEPAALNVVATVNDASCAGNCDGSISLNITGGTPGYTVNWSNGDTGTSVSGLCGGVISVTVVDANNCTFSNTYTIVQPNVFALSFSITNESVTGNDGAIDLTVTPSGTNYSYQWATSSNPNFSNNEDLINVPAAIYSVTVTDNLSGCTVAGVASVTNSLGIQTAIETDITCNGGDDGSIEIATVGGEPQYTWLWTGPNNFTAGTQSIFGLSAGTYNLTITDMLGVQLVESFTLTEPDAIEITSVDIDHESNVCDGSINIEETGGTGPYTYLWSNGATSQDVMDLCDGSYNVTITDAEGCVFESDNFIINPSAPEIGNATFEHISCNGGDDGELTVTIVGGNANYMATLTGPVTSSQTTSNNTVTFTGLTQGDYVVMITDSDGLTASSNTITINEPTPIAITNAVIMNQSATVCDGGVNITVAGGTLPYSYQWSNGSTNPDLTNVCAGNYDVTITDANGCILISPEYMVGINIGFAINVTHVDCHGETTGAIDLTVNGGVPPFSYVWTDSNGNVISNSEDVSNLPAGEYGVMISDAANTNIFTGMIPIFQPNNPITISATDITDPALPTGGNGEINLTVNGGTAPYDFFWEDQLGNQYANTNELGDLNGGTYSLTIVDANGCSFDTAFTLQGIMIPIGENFVDISCPEECDGRIMVEAMAGQPPFIFEWSTGATTSFIDNLCAGQYEVTITDDNGVVGTKSFVVTEPAPIQVTIDASPGRADFIVLGGTPDYTYQIDEEFLDVPFIEGLQGGTHMLQVTDANGCQSEIIEFQADYDTGCLSARNVISPNDDGFNDVFYVNCVDNQPVRVIIFNRWGQEVFEAENYDNTWAGTGKRGQALPEGGYFYVLEYEDLNTGAKEVIKGSISIVR